MAAIDMDETLVIAKLRPLIGGQAQVGSEIVGPAARGCSFLDAFFRNVLGGNKRGSRYARIRNGVIAVADFVDLVRQLWIENFRGDAVRKFVEGSGESPVDGACRNGAPTVAAAFDLRRNFFFGPGGRSLRFGDRFPSLACVLQALLNLSLVRGPPSSRNLPPSSRPLTAAFSPPPRPPPAAMSTPMPMTMAAVGLAPSFSAAPEAACCVKFTVGLPDQACRTPA